MKPHEQGDIKMTDQLLFLLLMLLFLLLLVAGTSKQTQLSCRQLLMRCRTAVALGPSYPFLSCMKEPSSASTITGT